MTAAGRVPSRGAIVAVVLPVALVGLTACGPLDDPSAPASTAPAATAAAPIPPSLLDPVAIGTVAATGELVGDVTGSVEVVRVESGYRLDFHDLVPAADGASIFLLSEPPVSAECSGARWALGVGALAPTVVLPPSDEFGGFLGDPTYLHGVQIAGADSADCVAGIGGYSIAGYAALTWTLPDLRPDLAPADTGIRDAASGAVELGDAGLPSQYRIADGDRFEAIAARFGITESDLSYLNPAGDWAEATTMIQAGCTLNIAKETRGATTRCPWRE